MLYDKSQTSLSSYTETSEFSDIGSKIMDSDVQGIRIDSRDKQSKTKTLDTVSEQRDVSNKVQSSEKKVRISTPGKSQKSREVQLTISLILICSMYLIFTTPYYLYFFLATEPYFDQTPKCYVDFHVAFGINSVILVHCNAALNIFVLLLVGRKFRKDLFSMFSKICQIQK